MHFKWQRTENGLFTNLGGETVILNLATNEYYSLNEVSTFIWEKLESTPTKEEVVEHVMNEYEVSKDQCEKDITLLIDELVSIDLIERVD